MINGIRTIRALLANVLTGAELETKLGTGSEYAGFVEALNVRPLSRALLESPEARVQLVLSPKAIKGIVGSSISASDFRTVVNTNYSLLNTIGATRALAIEYGNCPGSQTELAVKYTWPTQTMPSNLIWRGVAYNGDASNPVFVAVGSGASDAATTAGATSPDGITWSANTMTSRINDNFQRI